MKIEIWSDIVCPFCYIGKRNFEIALNEFADKDKIEIIWKSFQLNPDAPINSNINYPDYLSEKKGWSKEEVDTTLNRVTQSAKDVGLNYNLRTAKLLNTTQCHSIIQYAKTIGKANEVEEILFKAYFTDNINLNDRNELAALLKTIGIDELEMNQALSDSKYVEMTQADIQEAKQLDIHSVPFFVLNRKYAVSGAQPPDVFMNAIERSFSDWSKENASIKLDVVEGPSCDIDGNCD
ncbi:MAG TPA: DsbA family oxidoreductase [Edaphocola sp.]|nr:DsbA family oxidoreductase [Edaphocola sp.]